MSITIGAVTLEDPTRDQMYETSANGVSFSCTASTAEPINTDTKQTSYTVPIYEWTFSDGGSAGGPSGSYTFSDLAKGSSVTLTATVVVKSVKTTKTRYWIDDGYEKEIKDDKGNVIDTEWIDTSHWSDWTTTTENLSASGSDSQEANTHPGKCTAFSSLSFNDIIGKTLTSGMVSDWCTHCGEWLSWYNQQDCYSDADGCNINGGDLITASWFNGCVSTAESDTPSVVGGPKGTLISASLFHELDNLVSRRE